VRTCGSSRSRRWCRCDATTPIGLAASVGSGFRPRSRPAGRGTGRRRTVVANSEPATGVQGVDPPRSAGGRYPPVAGDRLLVPHTTGYQGAAQRVGSEPYTWSPAMKDPGVPGASAAMLIAEASAGLVPNSVPAGMPASAQRCGSSVQDCVRPNLRRFRTRIWCLTCCFVAKPI